MSKVGFLGDLHLGHSSLKKRFDVYEKIFKYVADLCLEHNIPHLVQFGDFFDVRVSIDISVLNFALDSLKKYWDDQPFEVDIIVGNHDLYFKNSRNITSARVLNNKELNNINIYTESFIKTFYGKYDVLYEPWLSNREDRDNFDVNISQAEYVFGHFELPFVIHEEAKDESITIDTFYGKKRVFSGHHHLPWEEDNFMYIGSACHNTWNDVNDQRYFYIYDFETNELQKFSLNHLFPNFIRLDYSDMDNTLVPFLKESHLEIILGPEHFDKYEEIHKFFNEKFNPISLNFIYKNKEELLQNDLAELDESSMNTVELSDVLVDIYTQDYGESETDVNGFKLYISEVENFELKQD